MLHRWKIVLSGLSLSLVAFGCKAKARATAEPQIVTEVKEPDAVGDLAWIEE